MTAYKFSDWKIWNGGECPVEPDTLVQTQRGDETRKKAECYSPFPASDWTWRWDNDGDGDDLIAYRTVMKATCDTLSCSVTIVTKGEPCTAYYSPGTVTLIDGRPDWSTLKAEGVE